MSWKDLTSGLCTENSELVAPDAVCISLGLSPPWVHTAGLQSQGAPGALLLG